MLETSGEEVETMHLCNCFCVSEVLKDIVGLPKVRWRSGVQVR